MTTEELLAVYYALETDNENLQLLIIKNNEKLSQIDELLEKEKV